MQPTVFQSSPYLLAVAVDRKVSDARSSNAAMIPQLLASPLKVVPRDPASEPVTYKHLLAAACHPNKTLIAVKDTHHAPIPNTNHPSSIWTPSNLRSCEMILGRKTGVDDNFVMRCNGFQSIFQVGEVPFRGCWCAIRWE